MGSVNLLKNKLQLQIICMNYWANNYEWQLHREELGFVHRELLNRKNIHKFLVANYLPYPNINSEIKLFEKKKSEFYSS